MSNLLRTMRRAAARSDGRPTHTDRAVPGPYGTTGRPKGEGAHVSGRGILNARRLGLVVRGGTVHLPSETNILRTPPAQSAGWAKGLADAFRRVWGRGRKGD